MSARVRKNEVRGGASGRTGNTKINLAFPWMAEFDKDVMAMVLEATRTGQVSMADLSRLLVQLER